MFLAGTSCCEATHASGYRHAWPRLVVSVNGSLTEREAGTVLPRRTLKSWQGAGAYSTQEGGL